MSHYRWFRQCCSIIPRNSYVKCTISPSKYACNERLKSRLGSHSLSRSPVISHSELQPYLRTNCVFPASLLDCSCFHGCGHVGCKQTLSHHLPQKTVIKPALLHFKDRNLSYGQVRYFSHEAPISPPAQYWGLYKFLSESAPVVTTQDLLVQFHDISGLPWWAAIMVSTVALRVLVTLPLAIYQYYILAKVENLTTEMSALVEELKRETAFAIKKFNWTSKQAQVVYNRSLKKQWDKLVVRDNCHPAKASILIFVQLPMWIFMSSALRNLVYMLPHQDAAAQVTCLELGVSHFLWISNLLTPDASWILPVTLGLTNLAIIELQALSKLKEPGRLQKFVTHFFRLVSIGMIPVAASVPACLNIYWLTSSAFGLVQNVALMSPRVKRLCGIPDTPSTQEKPYRHIALQFKKKTGWGEDKR